jgi:phage terminase large subunit
VTELADLLQYLSPAERRQAKDDLRLLAQIRGPEADVAYQTKPIDWMWDVLRIPEHLIRWSLNPEYDNHKWDGTPDPLAVICDAIAAGVDTGVESAIGTGKTYLAAAIALWFNASWRDSIVLTTAPRKDSLTKLLWKEIGAHWPRFKKRYPSAEKIELTARMRPGADAQEKWAIVGQTASVSAGAVSAAAMQGHHAADMLVITEETPGIPPAIMEAVKRTLVGAHNIQLSLGNPDAITDPLHKFCKRRGVKHVRISALDHPNVVIGREVIPGATSREGIAKTAEDHPVDTPMYDSRVRGIAPEQAAESLIQLAWLREAVARAKAKGAASGLVALGLDPANSQAGDKAAIAKFIGPRLMPLRSFLCPDANQMGRDVYAEFLNPELVAIPVRPEHVGVDNVGVGAGTLNELRKLAGPMVVACSGGSVDSTMRAPDGTSRYAWVDDSNRFKSLRRQMLWQLREDARRGVLEIEEADEELFEELTIIKWAARGGFVWIEEKDEIKKKLGRSPNKADATAYGNWVRARETLQSVVNAAAAAGRDPNVVRQEAQQSQLYRPEGDMVDREASSVGSADSQFGSDW